MFKPVVLVCLTFALLLGVVHDAWAGKVITLAEDVLCENTTTTDIITNKPIRMRGFTHVAFLGRGTVDSASALIYFVFSSKPLSSPFSTPASLTAPASRLFVGRCEVERLGVSSCRLNNPSRDERGNNLARVGGPFLAVGYQCDSDAVNNGFRFDLDIWLTK